MARRSDHSREEIRELALTAAEALVAEGGHKALSARKVAAEIGYTVGTLYLVFENLDDLLLQVNGRTVDALYDWLSARKGGERADGQALCVLAEAYIDFAEQQASRWNMMFDYVAENDQTLPDWYAQKLSRLFSLIEEAFPDKNVDPDMVVKAARVLWASVHGICLLKIRQQMDLAGGQSTREMTRMLIDNFLAGMRVVS